MRREGYEGRSICEITNHRDPNSLIHYDGASDMNEKFQKANAILKIKPSVAKRVATTVTTNEIAEVTPLLEAMSGPSTSTTTKSQEVERTNEVRVLSQEITTVNRKSSKKMILSLDPFPDDGDIDFNAIEESVVAKLDNDEVVYDVGTKLTPKAEVFVGELSNTVLDTERLPSIPGIKRKTNDQLQIIQAKKRNMTDQEICQKEMAIFEDKNVAQNFFQDWISESKSNQILIGREQMLRRKDQEIRMKDQEIINKSVEAHIKTNDELMALLKKIIENRK